jgi:hypothetical protein
MACFQTINPTLAKFWSVLQQKMLVNFRVNRPIYCHFVYFVVILYILWSFCIFYGHFVYLVVILYTLWSFWYIIPVLVHRNTKNLATLVPIVSAYSFGKWQVFGMSEWHEVCFLSEILSQGSWAMCIECQSHPWQSKITNTLVLYLNNCLPYYLHSCNTGFVSKADSQFKPIFGETNTCK